MFCTNCGKPMPDGTRFCTNCGTALIQPQASQPQPGPWQPQGVTPPAKPVYQAPPQQDSAPARPLTKKQFLASPAGTGARRRGVLVFITMLLCLGLMAASVLLALGTSIFELPAITLVMELAEVEDKDEITRELQQLYDETEEEYELSQEFLTPDQKEILEDLLDAFRSIVRTPSMNNLSRLLEVYDQYKDDLEDEFDVTIEEAEEIEIIAAVVKYVPMVLWGMFLLPLLFTLLGGLLRSTGFTITALIFTFLSQIGLCSIPVVAVTAALFIIQAVLCGSINRAYKKHLFGRA